MERYEIKEGRARGGVLLRGGLSERQPQPAGCCAGSSAGALHRAHQVGQRKQALVEGRACLLAEEDLVLGQGGAGARPAAAASGAVQAGAQRMLPFAEHLPSSLPADSAGAEALHYLCESSSPEMEPHG